MPVSLEEMMAEISLERRARIESEAAAIIQESTIADLRKAVGVTQKVVAHRMKISQASLSEIETRTDARVSTLSRVVEAVGAKLRLYAELPSGVRIPLAVAKKGDSVPRAHQLAMAVGRTKARKPVKAGASKKAR